MPWQSPYRGEASPADWLSPRAREWVSRGAMALVGGVMVYFSARGLWDVYDVYTTHTVGASVTTYNGRSGVNIFPWMPVVGLIGLGLIGLLTLAATLVPVSLMQRVFESWNTPPVTGDRDLDTRGLGGLWWFRWWRW